MKILIVAPFCSLPDESHDNRFLFLAEKLSNDHHVTLITSKFRHADKQHRTSTTNFTANFRIVLLNEPGYRKNLSFSRLVSHNKWLKNLTLWIQEHAPNENFDVVYSAFPLVRSNTFLGSVKHKYGFRLIIDVQDTWPESIISAIPILRFLPWDSFPLSQYADAAYFKADAIVAVSETYLNRARLANPTAPSLSIYIGANYTRIVKCASRPLHSNISPSTIDVVYLGSLGHSYDIVTLIKAFNELSAANPLIFLHLIGCGPNDKYLKSIATNNIIFHGLIDYDSAIGFAKNAKFLVNPIKNNAIQSVTNKLSDYFCINKPILNSQNNIEVINLLKHVPHVNYVAGNILSLHKAVEKLMEVGEKNNHPEFISLFDRDISYSRLQKFIERVGSSVICQPSQWNIDSIH